MHQDLASRQCVLCLEDKYYHADLYHLLLNPLLCITCIQQLEIVEKRGCFCNFPICILYTYNDFFKKALFCYKGQSDYALKDIFLDIWKVDYQKKYKDYIIVCAPSFKEDNLKRGFVPNEGIVSCISNNIFTGLYKKYSYKQTDAKNREDIKQVIAIENGEQLYQQKVLLFDDVVTSGNTLKACIALIQKQYPISIEILVLASKQILTVLSKNDKI